MEGRYRAGFRQFIRRDIFWRRFWGLGAMETVWQVADIFNGLMAVPNLAALVLLVGEIDAPGEKERDTGKRETAE